MLRPGTEFKPWEMNVCSNYGGMGDFIARLPAIKWAHDNYPHLKMNIFWHDYFTDLARFVLPQTDRLRHWPLTMMKLCDETLPLTDFNPNRITSLALDLTVHAFLCLVDRLPPGIDCQRLIKAPEVKPSIAEADLHPFGYVVLTPEFTSRARMMDPKATREVIDWLLSLNITPVILGTGSSISVGNGNEIQTYMVDGFKTYGPEVVNLIGKTTLIEALGIIQRARAIVGVDGGLLYLAGMTETPRVRGMTTVRPEHRLAFGHGPLENVVPENLACFGCQSDLYFVKHDFRGCVYGDFACTPALTGAMFIEKLRRFI